MDVGLDCGYALEVLQRLFEVTQVENVAGARRDGVPGGGLGGRARREADAVDAPGYQGEREGAALEVLRGGQDAGGDVATSNDGVLDTLQHDVDAGGAEAVARGRVVNRVGCLQRPAKAFGKFTIEQNPGDREAGRFLGRESVDGKVRNTRQACVRRGFQLFAQNALALLLA
ncbi:hypothetical protein D3C80_975190 [compost metagenome]